MKIFYQSIPLIKMMIFLYILWKIGIIYGLGLSIILHKVHIFIVEKIFLLEPLTPGDLNFMWINDDERYNIVIFLIFDSFDSEKIKELIIEKGIKNFRKLRSKLIFRFFEWYWQEVPFEKALERIEIIKNDKDYCFNSKQDIIKFGSQQISQKFNLLEELPFKFTIIQNDNAKIKYSLGIKFDHTFTDGLGFIGLICALADNYSIDLFPRNTSKNRGFLDYLMILLSTPYYIFYTIYRNLFVLSTKPSPFKMNGKIKSGNPHFQETQLMDFAEITKICKSLNITFNDLIMSVISSSCKKFCKDNNLELPEELSALIPIGHRKIPKTIRDINISNDSTGVGCKIHVIDDPVKECHKIHQEFSNHVRNAPFIIFSKYLTDVVMKFLPDYLSKFIIRQTSKNIDFTISNVPGPKNALYYSGAKMNEMMAFSSPGFFSSFIGVFSYNGTFKFFACLDEKLGLDVNKFVEYFYREIEYVKENVIVKY